MNLMVLLCSEKYLAKHYFCKKVVETEKNIACGPEKKERPAIAGKSDHYRVCR